MDFPFPVVVNRFLNRTARFCCVFGSTDGPPNVRSILRITSLILIEGTDPETSLFEAEFWKVWV